MTRHEIEAFVGHYIRGWNNHDVEALTAFYDDNAILVSPVFGELRGRDAIELSYRRFFAEWPNFSTQLVRLCQIRN